MTIGADGRFDALSNPVLRPMVAPAPLPPPGSMKKASRPVSQNQPPSTPSKVEHAKGPLNLSEALQNQVSVSTPTVPDTPATAAALAFIRRGRDQNMLSPSALRRTSVDSRGTAPLNVSQVSATTPAPAAATPASATVVGTSDLQYEVLHLRTKVGHLQRQLFESETHRNAGEAEAARKRNADKQEQDEAKRQIVAKLNGLRSLGEPIKYRLETLLDRGMRSSSASEGASTAHGEAAQGEGASKWQAAAPASQETRWSRRDLDTLNGAVAQLGLLLEAQTTLSARVSALAALHPVAEQVDTLLMALDKAQATQGALTLQLAQVTRERDELRDMVSSSSAAPPQASSVPASPRLARAVSGRSTASYRSGPAGAGPVDVSGEDAASVPSDAGRDPTASRHALRSLEARPDACLPGFHKAFQRIGATPSQVAQARVAGSSSNGVPLDDPDVDNEEVLQHERTSWNSFCLDLATALSPLESAGSSSTSMTKQDVGGRGGLLWKEARSIAREHRGAEWESERATRSYSQSRGAELHAFKAAFCRCTGHAADGIPPMVLIKLYDRVTGPLQQA